MFRLRTASEKYRPHLGQLLACALVLACQILGGALPTLEANAALQRAALADAIVLCDGSTTPPSKAPDRHQHAVDPALAETSAQSVHGPALLLDAGYLLPHPVAYRTRAICWPAARAPPLPILVLYEPTGPPSLV